MIQLASIRRTSVACVALLVIVGCPGDVAPVAGEASTTAGSEGSRGSSSGSSGGVGATSMMAADSSSGTTLGTSGGECELGYDSEGGPWCPEDVPIPRPPVDCTEAAAIVQGDVIIEPGGDDPSILEGVVRVEGSIRIAGTALRDLGFMACVREVSGDLVLEDDDALVDVDGLWSLEVLEGSFELRGNDALEDFDGLPNLPVLDRLVVHENGALQRITGFHSLVGIEGGVDAGGNPIGGDLTIQGNPVLHSIDGLTSLLVVNGVLTVSDNPLLCLSSILCVSEGIVQPADPPARWSVEGECC